ncbi:hypothetical protein L195_g064365, partial [Trifolium pratense]
LFGEIFNWREILDIGPSCLNWILEQP